MCPNENLNYQRYFLIRRRRPTNDVSPGLYVLKFKLDQRVSATRSLSQRIHSEILPFGEELRSSLHREKHAHHRCSSLDCFGKNSLVIMRWIFPVGMCRLVFINRKRRSAYLFKVFESENGKRITGNSSVILIRHVLEITREMEMQLSFLTIGRLIHWKTN